MGMARTVHGLGIISENAKDDIWQFISGASGAREPGATEMGAYPGVIDTPVTPD